MTSPAYLQAQLGFRKERLPAKVHMLGPTLYQRHRLPPGKRFNNLLRHVLQSQSGSWVIQGRWNLLLTIVLLIAIAAGIGAVSYVMAQPKAGGRFTEFYVLGLGGQARDYPREIVLGTEGRVILGIVNREQEPTQYRVETQIDGRTVENTSLITLANDEKWERTVGFLPRVTGPNQKVEFLLYKGLTSQPYRTLHLWVDVIK